MVLYFANVGISEPGGYLCCKQTPTNILIGGNETDTWMGLRRLSNGATPGKHARELGLQPWLLPNRQEKTNKSCIVHRDHPLREIGGIRRYHMKAYGRKLPCTPYLSLRNAQITSDGHDETITIRGKINPRRCTTTWSNSAGRFNLSKQNKANSHWSWGGGRVRMLRMAVVVRP